MTGGLISICSRPQDEEEFFEVNGMLNMILCVDPVFANSKVVFHTREYTSSLSPTLADLLDMSTRQTETEVSNVPQLVLIVTKGNKVLIIFIVSELPHS